MSKIPDCDFTVKYYYEGYDATFFVRITDESGVFRMLSVNSVVFKEDEDISRWMWIKILSNDKLVLKRSADDPISDWFEDTDEDADAFEQAFWEGYSTWKLEKMILE